MEHMKRFSVLLDCKTEMEWQETLLRLGREHGYEKVLLALVPDREAFREGVFIRGNYPEQWRNTYDRAGMASIDPVVSHCFRHCTPLIWEPGMFAMSPQKELYEEACSYGIRAGLTLPMHAAGGELGILCFVNDAKPGREFRRAALYNLPSLSLLRDFAFESARKFVRGETRDDFPPVITPRELECLKWSATGLSSSEISQKLRCSERTVNFHFGNLRQKLNAISTRQAVARAIRLKLI